MYGGPYKMYGAPYILYGAARTCMVRAVLYCAHLAIFMQYTGVFHTVAPCVSKSDPSRLSLSYGLVLQRQRVYPRRVEEYGDHLIGHM